LSPKRSVLHFNTYDGKSPKCLRVQTKRIVRVKIMVAIRTTCKCVVEIDLRNAADAVYGAELGKFWAEDMCGSKWGTTVAVRCRHQNNRVDFVK